MNQLSADGYAWYLTYLAVLDAKNLSRYGEFLADECEMFLNNQGPVNGKAAILAMLGQYWPTFGTLRHDLLAILGDDQSFMVEALNHYTRLDGSPVTLRAVAITGRDAMGLIRSVRIYSDTAALFQPAV